MGTWHHVAKQLGWNVDLSVSSVVVGDTSTPTAKIATELANAFAKCLRPYEEVSHWGRARTVIHLVQPCHAKTFPYET